MDKLEQTSIETAEWQEHFGPKIDDIHVLLHGSGSTPERGMVARVLKIENTVGVWTKAAWIFVGGGIIGLVGLVL